MLRATSWFSNHLGGLPKGAMSSIEPNGRALTDIQEDYHRVVIQPGADPSPL